MTRRPNFFGFRITYTFCAGGLLLALAGCGDQTTASNPVAKPGAAATDAVSPPPCPNCVTGEAPFGAAAKATPAPAAVSEIEQPAAAAASLDDPQGRQVIASTRASEWLAPAEREAFDFDFDFLDQDGQPLNLSALKGKPLALSFIFTRCSNPYMCPMITAQMATLESLLERAELEGKVNLVLMSYDPAYDTPQRLHKYGSDRGMKFTAVKMLQPEASQFRDIMAEFGIDARFSAKGVENHGMDLYLFDKEARRVRYYTAGVWDNQAVLGDLQKLVDEPAAEAP